MTAATTCGWVAIGLISFDAVIAFGIKQSSWDSAFTFTFWPAILLLIFAGIKGSKWWLTIPGAILATSFGCYDKDTNGTEE